MKEVSKKVLSLFLTLTLVLSVVGVVPTKVEAAEDLVVWNLWETSLEDNLGMVDVGTYELSDAKVNKITTISDKYTFIREDKEYSLNIESNYNTCSLEGISYNGYDSSLEIELPDKINIWYISDYTNDYATVRMATLKLTSISTAFDAKCVHTFGNASINLIVTNQITSIDKEAFAGNTNLRSVDFKGDIQTIGNGAFQNCNGLTQLDLTKTFQGVNNNTIPDNCFYNCTQLTNVIIPDSIIHIGKEAFYGCNKLDTIKLTDRIETVGKNAFGACSGLRYIYIESKASDWSEIVKSNELYKLITDTDSIEPIVTIKGSNNDLNGKYIFGASSIAIFSRVDIKDVVVKKDDTVVEDIYAYQDTTYQYKTNAYYFNILQNQKGVYTITVTDVEGNTCTKSFSYLSDKEDKVAPVISISGVGSGNYYQEATLTFKDNDTYVASSLLNDTPITSGHVVKTEGNYELVVTDIINNTSRRAFTIDKTAPTISGVSDGEVSKKGLVISLSDNLSGVKSAVLNGQAVDTKEFTVYNTGVYELVVTDMALNKSVIHFTIDTLGPSVKGLINDKYYNTDVGLNFESVCGIIDAKLTYTSLDDSNVTIDVKDGYTCTQNGSYSLKLKDTLGNSISYKFVIDKIQPKVTGVANNKHYKKKSLKFSIVDDNLDKVTLNGESISKSKSLKEEGKYTLVMTDKAGNTKTIKFTIDRTKPKCTVKNGKTYKKNVSIWGSDKVSGIKSVKLDNKTIKKKTKVKKKGSHKVIITDKAGNKTTVKFKVK